MKIEKLENGGYLATDAEMLVEIIKLGDKRCEFPISSNVVKTRFEEKDHTKTGTPGVVVGNMMINDEGVEKECYLVLFENSEFPTFISKDKIALVN
jgi:hypothetical protein